MGKPKFKIGDRVRISKYKRKICDKGYSSNWAEELFDVNEVLNTKLEKVGKPKFKMGDRVRISKYKRKIFDKGYSSNWAEELFDGNEVLNTKLETYKIVDSLGEDIKGSSYEQELQ